MEDKADDLSLHSLIAFAIVNLNVSVGLDFYENLTFSDPLYKAIYTAWEAKERRTDARYALICAVLANCHSGGQKKFTVDDFMPQKQKQTSEDEIRANFLQYEMYRQAKLIK